jgi:hypothetical protein
MEGFMGLEELDGLDYDVKTSRLSRKKPTSTAVKISLFFSGVLLLPMSNPQLLSG